VPPAVATVNALASFDDGTGPALYVGGSFTFAGAVQCSNLARWQNATWSDVGGGTSAAVAALLSYSSGSGNVLVVGGEFTTVGPAIPAGRVAAWTAGGWMPLGSGMDGGVRCLRIFDDGTGDALYAGGIFSTADGVAAPRIARFGPGGWTAAGTGMIAAPSTYVASLEVANVGYGPQLIAGGSLNTIAGPASIARLHGGSWVGIYALFGPVLAMTNHDFGTGPMLCVGWTLTQLPTQSTAGVSVFNPASYNSWTYLNPQWSTSQWAIVTPSVKTLLSRNTPAGPVLSVGGRLTPVAGLATRDILEWRASTAWPTGLVFRWGPGLPSASRSRLRSTA
jgi:hypothetical protein